MKNLLHCHSKNTHSFPISFEDGLYRRIFYAEETHNLWKVDPIEIAIHPHHVDVKITVLDGTLYNCLYEKDNSHLSNPWKMYEWDSVILNGKGGFKRTGTCRLRMIHKKPYKAGESFFMKACELHTVYVDKGKMAVWMVEEEKPTCEYFPTNYSNGDLTEWKPDGLYVEVDNQVRDSYIGKYITQ